MCRSTYFLIKFTFPRRPWISLAVDPVTRDHTNHVSCSNSMCSTKVSWGRFYWVSYGLHWTTYHIRWAIPLMLKYLLHELTFEHKEFHRSLASLDQSRLQNKQQGIPARISNWHTQGLVFFDELKDTYPSAENARHFKGLKSEANGQPTFPAGVAT